MTVRLRVRVHPGARRERIDRRMADGTWRIEVHAAPEAGRANEAVVGLLAVVLGVPRSRVRVVSGQSGRNKLVEVEGVESADVEARLTQSAHREG